MSSQKQKKLTDFENPTKKLKSEHTSNKEDNSFIKEIIEDRLATAASIKEFKFNKKRVRVLSKAKDISENAQSVLYWMSRDQRVQGISDFLIIFYSRIFINYI